MLKAAAKRLVGGLIFASVALGPVPAVSQSGVGESYEDAKLTLGSVFWTIRDIRAELDETRFNPAAMANALADDPDLIFGFVRDSIAFQPYPGMLRFGAGALMQQAGNACDQAALLGEMLIAAGHEVAFALAETPPDLADRLRASANIPSPLGTAPPPIPLPTEALEEGLSRLGYSAAMIQERRARAILFRDFFLSELDLALQVSLDALQPKAEAVLSSDAARPPVGIHCWVRLRKDESWIDLDPTARWVEAGETIVEPETIVPALPLTLAPTLSLKVQLELEKGQGLETKTLLERSSTLFRPVNEMSLGFVSAESSYSGDADRPDEASGYRAWLSVNGRRAFGDAFELDMGPPTTPASSTGAGLEAAGSVLGELFEGTEEEKAEPSPDGSGRLKRITFELTIRDHAGAIRTERRVLVSRPAGVEEAAATEDVRAQLSGRVDAVIWGGRIDAEYLEARDYDALLDEQPLYEAFLDHRFGKDLALSVEEIDAAVDGFPVALLELARLRSALTEHAARLHGDVAIYYAFPQVIALRRGPTPRPEEASQYAEVVDFMVNAVAVDGDATGRRAFELGLADTLIEYLIVGGGESENAYTMMLATAQADGELITVLPGDRETRDLLAPPAAAATLIDDDLAKGYAVIAPPRPVELADGHVYGWLRLDPESGETLGRGALGGQATSQRTILTGTAVRHQLQILPMNAAICAAFTTISPYLGQVQQAMARALGSDEPIGEARERSTADIVAEHLLCVVMGQTLGGVLSGGAATKAARQAGSSGARGAAVAAVGGTGMAAVAGAGRGRAPVAARPAGTRGRTTVPPRYSSAARAEQPRIPAPRRHPASFESRADTVIERVRPPRGADADSGTYIDGQPSPPPRKVPPSRRTAAEDFDYGVETMFGPGAARRDEFIVARGRWEGMTPRQRRAAYDTFRRLRQADPTGDPVSQFRHIVENARAIPATPELIAQGAFESRLLPNQGPVNPGISLRKLADAAGVTPQEMRLILDTRIKALSNGRRRIEVGADGQVRVMPRDSALAGLSTHERQIAEMSRQSNRRNAARDARFRASRDAADGLSVEQSLAGYAHHEGIPAAEYLRRTGQTAAEGVDHLATYLQHRGLSPAEARAAANDYFGKNAQIRQAAMSPVQPREAGVKPSGKGLEVRAAADPVVDTLALSPDEIQAILVEEKFRSRPTPEEAGARSRGKSSTASSSDRLPADAEFQTREARQRLADAEMLTPAERKQLGEIDRRIADIENEFVLGEKAEHQQEVELYILRSQRESILAKGRHFQQRLTLRQRQQSAAKFSPPEGAPAIRQPTPENGRTPLRQMVRGDQRYLRAIMEGSRFEPSQNHVYSETINHRAQQILDGGPFPTARDGGPIVLHEVAPGRYVIVSGHHRVVAAQIAHRLTRRPLLPGDAAGTGLAPIIPEGQVLVRPSVGGRVVRGWEQLGVR